MFAARNGVSLTITLAVSISLLVLVAVAAVLGVGLWSGTQNTLALLRDKAQFVTTAMAGKVRDHLRPAENQLAFIGRLVADGRVDPADKPAFATLMTGALAAAPQISAILHVDPDYQTIIVARSPEGPHVFYRDDTRDQAMRQAMSEVAKAAGAKWGEPLWRELPKETMLNLRQGLRRNGELVGFLIAAVRVRDLSDHLRNLNPINGGTVFVLYGRDRVLAHPNLLEPLYRRSAERPLLRLEEVGDPLLASIWETEGRQPLRIIKGTDLKGHVLQRSNGTYVYIYKDLEGLGDKAWQIGTYFRNSAINREMRRLRSALLVGLGMLAMAVLLAVILARRISRPVVELARAASRIGQLDISATQPLPGSIFRELDDQARAFNAMLQGLGWFETYVPKRLVRRLIRQSASGLPASEDREVTVMFTDIAGFTGLAEGKPAAEVASFLNSHFSLLARCIESDEGTVDKFIGDSVMAFWGAPDDQPDHRERAVRAARAICKALASDNAERRAKGLEPIRVRIGLHSGRVTVGNIGAPGRINYTIVGDTVNVGQRLEAYGKTLAARDVADGGAVSGVIVLVSAATVDMLADTSDLVSIGAVRLQGRDTETEVYRLCPPWTGSCPCGG